MRISGLILIPVFFTGSVCSQDIHFSQVSENPALVNPALCGANNPMRVSSSYRDQWGSMSSAYKTLGFSFESRFNRSEWEKVDQFRTMTFKKRGSDRLAAGLSVYSDKAGDGRLGQTQVNLSLASFVPVSRQSFISVGLLGSFNQRQIDVSKLIFSDQLPDGQLDPDIGSGEIFSNLNYSYADLATGALWTFDEKKSEDVDRQLKAKMGISFYHLVNSKQKFLDPSNEFLQLKTVVHGDFTFGIFNTNKAFAPAYLLEFQGPYRKLMFGGFIKNYFNDNSHYTGLVKSSCFSYGVFYRVKDAVIFNALFEWKQQYVIGLSYDVTVSKLGQYNSMRGGFEITLKYVSPKAFLYQEKKKPML
jgi:type IX secretion system PorP/SprF family membrane protein